MDTDPESSFKEAVALDAIAEQTEAADYVYQVILSSRRPLKPPRVPAALELERDGGRTRKRLIGSLSRWMYKWIYKWTYNVDILFWKLRLIY